MAVWSRPNIVNPGLLADIERQYTTASDARIEREPLSTTDRYEYELSRKIVMSQRDFKLFLVAIDSDEEPNDTLKAAAEKFKQKYR